MVTPARNDNTLALYQLSKEARQSAFDDPEEVTLVGTCEPPIRFQEEEDTLAAKWGDKEVKASGWIVLGAAFIAAATLILLAILDKLPKSW